MGLFFLQRRRMFYFSAYKLETLSKVVAEEGFENLFLRNGEKMNQLKEVIIN
jgi:hypothetical protein